MKFQILLAIVFLSCFCSKTNADVVDTGVNTIVGNIANWPPCSIFGKCYAGCSWLNTCSIFKDNDCKAKCGNECQCKNSAANFRLTGVHYVFAAVSLLIALRTSL